MRLREQAEGEMRLPRPRADHRVVAVGANRVSFLFDFSGLSFAVDSACSSSLTAI